MEERGSTKTKFLSKFSSHARKKSKRINGMTYARVAYCSLFNKAVYKSANILVCRFVKFINNLKFL